MVCWTIDEDVRSTNTSKKGLSGLLAARTVHKSSLALLAVLGGIIILVVKLGAYLVSGSVALLSDAMESIVNIAASLLMLLSIRISMAPADEDHRYGHQKAENISSLFEGLLIILAALSIVLASVGRLFDPQPFTDLTLALIMSLMATGMNGALSMALFRGARSSGSIALEGDARHLLSDVISSLGIVAGLLLAEMTGWYVLDPILALLVAVLLVRMAFGLLGKASRDLMDHRCPESEALIEQVLRGQEELLQYHDLRTRRVGDRVFAEVHICLRADSTMAEAHELTERIEDALRKDVPGLVLNIHMETEREVER